MIKSILSALLALVLALPLTLRAEEGMWLPMLIKKLNEADMQSKGLKLTAEDIYSVNNSSIKDAIVHFGGFCTGEIISPDGLILTNHHCGYEAVAALSTVNDDILTNGFFATSRDMEKPAEGLYVRFLIRMEDVTEKVKEQLGDSLTDDARTQALPAIYKKMQEENSEGGKLKVDVKPMFHGNEYYMFIYETYKDIRLVGAPPESVGKFGGDTDNWMWPRHTGDFSLFRIYMSPDGKPAEYSKDNVPYKSKHFLPVSTAGVKKDDFAMILGYPGKTDRYLTSSGVDMAVEQTNPAIVKLRTKRLAILKDDMDADKELRLKYAADYAKVSNYWKYFIGQTKGLKRMRTAEQKRDLEARFDKWANSNAIAKNKYGGVNASLQNAYSELEKYNVARWYLQEGIFGTQIFPFAYTFASLESVLKNKDASPEEIKKSTDALQASSEEFFKSYSASTDEKMVAALLQIYAADVPISQQSPYFISIKNKYKGDFKAYAAKLMSSSMFADKAKLDSFLKNPSLKKLQKDMAYIAVMEIYNHYVNTVRTPLRAAQAKVDNNMRLFMQGLREMDTATKFYPDANSTMRITYGSVQDYYPMDGAYYNYYTTIDGIIEKMDNTSSEFKVPSKVVDLYNRKDFGRYSEEGNLRINFITTNDITGGNSGSPVINGNGELIGLAFDGNWEAMSGDIDYDEKYKRTICVDARYILWYIEKIAGANSIINELKLVN